MKTLHAMFPAVSL